MGRILQALTWSVAACVAWETAGRAERHASVRLLVCAERHGSVRLHRCEGMPVKTYVYRLYPSRSQERLLNEAVETCRRFYNDCLAERKEAYEKEKRSISRWAQQHRIKERRAVNPYAFNVPFSTLAIVIEDLENAYKGYFRRVKAGEKPGFPRFRSRNEFDSFGIRPKLGCYVDGRRFKIKGIGRIAVRWHRPMEGRIRIVRVARRPDGWYACFVCESEPKPLPATGRAVGIDVGLQSLATTSDGEKVSHPHFYQAGQRRLRVLSRAAARKGKGGMNRKEAYLLIGRHHQQLKNQRQDFLRKLAASLVNRYDFIAMEDLQIGNLVMNHNVAKNILDAGWGYLARRIAFKATECGRQFVLVDPAYTSKCCSACGQFFEGLTIKVRDVACPCGLAMDRDVNAAVNILRRAEGMLSV